MNGTAGSLVIHLVWSFFFYLFIDFSLSLLISSHTYLGISQVFGYSESFSFFSYRPSLSLVFLKPLFFFILGFVVLIHHSSLVHAGVLDHEANPQGVPPHSGEAELRPG